MPLILQILMACLLGGVLSLLAAFLILSGLPKKWLSYAVSFSTGVLLATSMLHLLPEAFEGGIEPHNLFVTLLVGLLFFFLLDKAELWHHGHEHHHHHGDRQGHDHDHHQHAHNHAHNHTDTSQEKSPGGWAILAGDSVHCFGDGVLIASAFMVEMQLGIVAALAVLAHEVPHHMGDLVVLRESSGNRQAAILKVSLAGAVTALGGIAGYLLLESLSGLLPYMLAIASSSFIYVALADLIPQLQKRLSSRETAAQIVWLVSGIALVSVVSYLAHGGLH